METEYQISDADHNAIEAGIDALVRVATAINKSKGWHSTGATFLERLVMIHSEISEAVEAFRDPELMTKPIGEIHYDASKPDKPIGVASELADVLIRLADACGVHNIELSEATMVKLRYNLTRPYRHGGKRI